MDEHHLGDLESAAKGRPEGSGECVCKAQADVLVTGPGEAGETGTTRCFSCFQCLLKGGERQEGVEEQKPDCRGL